MKKHLLFSLLLLFSIVTSGQNAKADSLQLLEMEMNISDDSLKSQLQNTTDNIQKIDLLGYLTFYYAFINPEQGLAFGEQGQRLAEQENYERGMAYCTQSMSFCLMVLGNYNEALR